MNRRNLKLYIPVLGALALIPAQAFGQTLISQATVTAAGGFPYKITQPGRYQLSSDLVVSNPNTEAIQISVDNVNLDLAGFTISGPATCHASSCCPVGRCPLVAGIHVLPYTEGVISNGSITGFIYGILAQSLGRLQNLNVHHNGVDGANIGYVEGFGGATVEHCRFTYNGGQGLLGAGQVLDSYSAFNSGNGFIYITSLMNSVSIGNGGWGVYTVSFIGGNYFEKNSLGSVDGYSFSQKNNACANLGYVC